MEPGIFKSLRNQLISFQTRANLVDSNEDLNKLLAETVEEIMATANMMNRYVTEKEV